MSSLKTLLEKKYRQFNRPDFIPDDPISIPHRFKQKEDIEIMAFLIALLSWGQRKSILRSGEKLIALFDSAPMDFMLGHTDSDLKACRGFVHRTFNDTDLFSVISLLRFLYTEQGGLEAAFSRHMNTDDPHTGKALSGFRSLCVNSDFFARRTLKHIASPDSGSACKRLNMFLRWMVRKDKQGVDFGLWQSISPAQLLCPLDVHVLRQANRLGIISSEKSDWKTTLALSEKLKELDAHDPVRYDFALFGLGIEENLQNKAYRIRDLL